MPVTAKICGLSTPETLDAAIAGGASHVGFVFFPPSPRNLGFDAARGLTARVPGHVRKVGVFVDPDEALLDGAIAAAGLDVIQLHGTRTRAADVRRRTGREVWGVIEVKQRADLAGRHHIEAVDRIVYDAKVPVGSALPGGMGVRFDWSLLSGLDHPLPWVLAGGLTPDNVAEAVRVTGAALVDVSSGVESSPGVKDAAKIAAFLRTVASL